MIYKSITWLMCAFVVVTVAVDYSNSASITEPDPKFTVYSEGTEDLESPAPAQAQEGTEPAAVGLAALLDAGESAMVTLVAGDTRLVAHGAVLAAGSRAFAAALEAGSRQIDVPDVEGPVLRHLVAYLYTGQAPRLPAVASQLLVAADKYGVPALRAECERQVADQLSVENAAAVAVFAVRHSYAGLAQAAVDFIRNHLVPVMGSQAWADAMHTYTEELIRVSQMLSDPPAETSSPATTPAATQLQADLRRCGRTPVNVSACRAATRRNVRDSPLFPFGSLSAEKLGKSLIEAAKDGDVEELRALIAAGADLTVMGESARNWDKWTALHWAAWQGDVESVRTLLEGGVEVGIRSSARLTPLEVASWMGHVDVVRVLLAACANPNTANRWGFTPLHEAAKHGSVEVAAMLLEAGADREAKTEQGKTPLDLAIDESHPKLANLLRCN